MELYRKYRPTMLAEIRGQDHACATLQSWFTTHTTPHVVLFTGPSGVGKTTLARIIRDYLHVGDFDFNEINSADFRGIEMVRDIRARLAISPMEGKFKVWLIDEIHQLTKDAQTALLKMLEDTPAHVFFLLCTTDPEKLLSAIKTRATEIKLNACTENDLQEIMKDVLQKSKCCIKISKEELALIAEISEGSPRKALVILNQIISMENKEERLAAIKRSESKIQAIELARALLTNPRWGVVKEILNGLKDDPEGVRLLVLAYATTVLLGGGKLAARAYLLIKAFEYNYYDSKRAGLVASCWDVCQQT